MDEELMKQVMRKMGAKGGRRAAANMTPAERKARARKAAAASAKVRSAQAKARKRAAILEQEDARK